MNVERGKWYLIAKGETYNTINIPVYAQCIDVLPKTAWFKINDIWGTKVLRTSIFGEVEDPRFTTKFKQWWRDDV
ncbi:MAG: hypothetical protein GY707_05675 [Desulfobacteraceae bacterium]|nr:hypothetical protein [Desulfobacteraceae bacterium]